jgi:branched-chain amino acid transport system ATP-binding protein
VEERVRKAAVEEVMDFLGLAGRAGLIVSSLAPLDSKLVELGRALATRPRLILLDELIGGLLPAETEKICRIIEALKRRGLTVFQIGHEMGPIMKTSDWVFVLDEGRKIAEGTPEEVRANREVHDVYLE